MKKTIALALLLGLAACGQQQEGKPVTVIEFGENGETVTRTDEAKPSPTPSVAANSACEKVKFEDVALTHCIADPARDIITMALGPKGGAPYRSFSKLAAAIGKDKVVFAMNGGMYDGEGKPIGYYVQDSNRLKELNTADGPGNFHMKPNGVFYGSKGSWHIRTTASFLANVSDRPQFGTQSGPMLLIDGKLHPEFSDDGPSQQIRNGVGVDRKGRAHFVISDGPISFGKLARFFRDVADTPNALYLDGNVSALWDPVSGRMDGLVPIGPMIVVEKKK